MLFLSLSRLEILKRVYILISSYKILTTPLMNIQELKLKSSEQLITQAEELGIENASTLKKTRNFICNIKKSC